MVVSRFGTTKFNDRPEVEDNFPLEELASELNAHTDMLSSLFGETWSSEYTTGVEQGAFLYDILGNTTLGDSWHQPNNKISPKLGITARLLQPTQGTRRWITLSIRGAKKQRIVG